MADIGIVYVLDGSCVVKTKTGDSLIQAFYVAVSILDCHIVFSATHTSHSYLMRALSKWRKNGRKSPVGRVSAVCARHIHPDYSLEWRLQLVGEKHRYSIEMGRLCSLIDRALNTQRWTINLKCVCPPLEW